MAGTHVTLDASLTNQLIGHVKMRSMPVEPSVDEAPVAYRYRVGPPRVWFHGFLVTLAIAILISWSWPYCALLVWAVVVVTLATIVVWLIWLVVFRVVEGPWSRWFALAPAIGLVVVALLSVHLPIRARWILTSQSAFDEVVAAIPAASTPRSSDIDPQEVTVPGWIGTYHITSAERVDGGFLFREGTLGGGFLSYAGFAYLPDGPNDTLASGSFESPDFVHLSGPWYAFTASW